MWIAKEELRETDSTIHAEMEFFFSLLLSFSLFEGIDVGGFKKYAKVKPRQCIKDKCFLVSCIISSFI